MSAGGAVTAAKPAVLETDPGGVCPNCGGRGLEIFYRQDSVPVQSILLLDDAETARSFPRAGLRLGLCGACGFITNADFRPEVQEFSARYEETQGFSPRFREFASALARGWVERYGLEGKTVLEIGCGKGEFLALMCEVGGCDGIGYDPAYVEGRLDSPARSRIEFVADFYSEAHADVRADAIVCRHTLEHIRDTAAFLGMVRRAIGERRDTVVLFEVPDMTRILREVAFWDVFYEHCSYFTAGSLAHVFRAQGFEIVDLRLEYDGQYLIIEARPAEGPQNGPRLAIEPRVEATRRAAAGFAQAFARNVGEWTARIESVTSRDGTVVAWGSGSKATGFLTTLGVDRQVTAVVDINPMRHGTFVAGTGHEIVAPERLKEIRPDLVVAMNPIYCDEIRGDLARMGLHPEVVGL